MGFVETAVWRANTRTRAAASGHKNRESGDTDVVSGDELAEAERRMWRDLVDATVTTIHHLADDLAVKHEMPHMGKLPVPPAPEKSRIALDQEGLRIRIGKKWWDLTEEQVKVLAVLFTANGAWVGGAVLGIYRGKRPDKIKRSMPKPVQRIIETHGVHGYRIKQLRPDV